MLSSPKSITKVDIEKRISCAVAAASDWEDVKVKVAPDIVKTEQGSASAQPDADAAYAAHMLAFLIPSSQLRSICLICTRSIYCNTKYMFLNHDSSELLRKYRIVGRQQTSIDRCTLWQG